MGLVLWAGLLTGTAALPDAHSADVQVKDAWIRWLPANLPGGGYMTPINTRGADYGEVSIHQTRIREGLTEMARMESVELKPLIPVRFAEGGYHLMLMQPKRSLRPGDRVPITLHFAQGPSIEVPFEVRAGNST